MQRLVDIPRSVTLAYQVGELVPQFCRRLFRRAAEIVGLPLTEQGLFADALIQQYPAHATRRWLGRDPTPRDNNPAVQTSDFNHILLRQYLNERPGAGRRRISERQLRAIDGRVSHEHTLDDVTRAELERWRNDFIYRGGELFSGRNAPIGRTGIVPALQAPAERPDITWIPQIMDAKGWSQGATLMREWFRRPARERPPTMRETPNNFGPPVLNVVRMDWVIGFSRARAVYDRLMNKMWITAGARGEIGRMLTRTGVVAQARANQGQPIRFGDLTSANVIGVEDVYIQSQPMQEGWLDNAVNYVSGSFDGLTAALANFNFHMAVKGTARAADSALRVTIDEVGVYVKDSYDFINEEGDNQRLGVWEQGVGSVSNSDFNTWRTNNNRGGDFLVYSDIKVTRLSSPDTFTVAL